MKSLCAYVVYQIKQDNLLHWMKSFMSLLQNYIYK